MWVLLSRQYTADIHDAWGGHTMRLQAFRYGYCDIPGKKSKVQYVYFCTEMARSNRQSNFSTCSLIGY